MSAKAYRVFAWLHLGVAIWVFNSSPDKVFFLLLAAFLLNATADILTALAKAERAS